MSNINQEIFQSPISAGLFSMIYPTKCRHFMAPTSQKWRPGLCKYTSVYLQLLSALSVKMKVIGHFADASWNKPAPDCWGLNGGRNRKTRGIGPVQHHWPVILCFHIQRAKHFSSYHAHWESRSNRKQNGISLNWSHWYSLWLTQFGNTLPHPGVVPVSRGY